MDDLFKTSKAAHSEEVLRLREDTRQRLDESEQRMYTQFARMLDESSRAIED